MINSEISFKSLYDEHRSKATKQKQPSRLTWTKLLEYDNTSLIIDDITYQELAKYRFWARDIILRSWFKYCLEGESRRRNSANFEILLYKLLGYIYTSDLSRDPLLISHYRDFYDEIDLRKCIYSGRVFEPDIIYHLDHFLPWSFYPINRFWNLYPSDPAINIKKSNNIPEWTEILEENIRSHIKLCLINKEHPLINNDLKYYYFNLQKNKDLDILNRENELIEEEIITFIKSERQKLLEIIPGQIFNFLLENDK